MPNVGLDSTRRIEVPPGAAVIQLVVTSLGVGVFIHGRGVADGVDVTRCVISVTRELFREDEGMEF